MEDKYWAFVSSFGMLLLLLVVLLIVCIPEDIRSCNSIWIKCDNGIEPYSICDDCLLLSQSSKGDIVYFQLFDCEAKKTLQSSVSDNCTVSQH